MKNFKFSSIILVVIFVTTMFSACEEPSTNNSAIVYKNGEMITNNIIKTYYFASEKLNYKLNSQLDIANLLSGNSEMADSEQIILVDNYRKKIEIFSYYSNILKSFEENNIDKSINKQFISLLNSIDSLNNVELKEETENVRNYTLSVNFDDSKGLYEITNLVYSIWLNDVLNWEEILNNSFEKYSKVVDNIPESAFDETKLEKFVYAPYKGKQNLVNVYKLNLKQEAFDFNNSFNDKTTILLSAFDLYSQIVNELAKTKPDFNFIYLSHEKILSQLNNLEN